jgi:ribose 5-phosphate isomerase B
VIIYAASDHAGYNLRKTLVERLRVQSHETIDLGTDSDAACDYPEFASAVANSVRGTPGSLGILVCATGQGLAIAAGKVRGIRAVVPATVEAARLSRFDNDANVLCLAGRLMSEGDAFAIVDTWLSTAFAGGRHSRRIAKVAAIETASAVAFITEGERFGLTSRGVPGRLFAHDPALFTSD